MGSTVGAHWGESARLGSDYRGWKLESLPLQGWLRTCTGGRAACGGEFLRDSYLGEYHTLVCLHIPWTGMAETINGVSAAGRQRLLCRRTSCSLRLDRLMQGHLKRCLRFRGRRN
jgi:hypothetical protein